MSVSVNNCSFCGIFAENSSIIVKDKNNKVGICKTCIDKCYYSIKKLEGETRKNSCSTEQNYLYENRKITTPKEILKIFDEYIISQNKVKKILSVAAYNHKKRLSYIDLKEESEPDNNEVEIEKSNILLIGDTGTGKTLFAKTLSKIMEVPMVIVDATSYTQAGYVGEDVENAIARLYQQSGYDIEKTEKGIICIDEIDKTTRKTDGHSPMKDVSGEGVQQALLKLLEGTIVNIPAGNMGNKKSPTQSNQQQVKIDTKNILFICSGSFEGLEQIIFERISGSRIGFNADVSFASKSSKDTLKIRKTNSDDLIKYGLIPEFVARIPVIATLDPLKIEDLVNILTVPRNALVKQYKKLFELDNVELKVEEDALERIADWAFRKKNGARGLRSIMENILLDYMFDLPTLNESRILLNKAMVEKAEKSVDDINLVEQSNIKKSTDKNKAKKRTSKIVQEV